MKKLSKRIIILSVLIIITISTIVLLSQKTTNINIYDYKPNGNSLISMMIQDENGNYVESDDVIWPGEGYHFNAKLSKCKNGSRLKYNELESTVNVETANPDMCYVYFDYYTFNFPYTEEISDSGESYEFEVPATGTYKIELWGASGGNINKYFGGNGAYTKGNIYVTSGTKLYIYVGGQGIFDKDQEPTPGFNGGGVTLDSQKAWGGTGGGATDIRLTNGVWNNFGSLKDRIMVAAGGGGANYRGGGYGEGNGGAAGGLIGETGFSVNHTQPWGYSISGGGTQTGGGQVTFVNLGVKNPYEDENVIGHFGFGDTVGGQSGGGGGYYGGSAGLHAGAGGGSSYISGYKGCVAIKDSSTEENVQPKENCTDETTNIECSYHYSGNKFTETQMIAGTDTMPKPDGGTEVGHTGNGYARITFVK